MDRSTCHKDERAFECLHVARGAAHIAGRHQDVDLHFAGAASPGIFDKVKLGLAVQEKSWTSSEWIGESFRAVGIVGGRNEIAAGPTTSFCGRVTFTSNVPKSAKNSEVA